MIRQMVTLLKSLKVLICAFVEFISSSICERLLKLSKSQELWDILIYCFILVIGMMILLDAFYSENL